MIISRFEVGKTYYREVPYKKWFRRVQRIVVKTLEPSAIIEIDGEEVEGVVRKYDTDFGWYQAIELKNELLNAGAVYTKTRIIRDFECGDREIVDSSSLNIEKEEA